MIDLFAKPNSNDDPCTPEAKRVRKLERIAQRKREHHAATLKTKEFEKFLRSLKV